MPMVRLVKRKAKWQSLAGMTLAVVTALGCSADLRAQAPGGNPPQPVQVTVLRQNRAGGDSMQIDRGMAITQVSNATAMQLIEAAYGLEDSQLSGGPDWIERIHYNITYVGGALSNAGTSAALQQILADRFHLVLKQQKKSAPVYALVVAEGGRKFKEAAPLPPPEPGSQRPISEMTIREGKGELTLNGGMSSLLTILRAEVDRPILDRTGLTASYAIQFHWTSEGDSGKLLSQELQQQLGLQLVPQEAEMPFCTIERIEQPKETEAAPA